MALSSSSPSKPQITMQNKLIKTTTSEQNTYTFEPYYTTPTLFTNNPPTLLHTDIQISQHRKPFSKDTTKFHYILKLPPHTHLVDSTSTAPEAAITVLVWNCRGAARPGFLSTAKELVEKYKPLVFIVLDTRLSGDDAKDVYRSLPYRSASVVRNLGYVAGMWMLHQFPRSTSFSSSVSDGSISLNFELKPLGQPEAEAQDGVGPSVPDQVSEAEQANSEQAVGVVDLAFQPEQNAEQAALLFNLALMPVLEAEQLFGLAFQPEPQDE